MSAQNGSPTRDANSLAPFERARVLSWLWYPCKVMLMVLFTVIPSGAIAGICMFSVKFIFWLLNAHGTFSDLIVIGAWLFGFLYGLRSCAQSWSKWWRFLSD